MTDPTVAVVVRCGPVPRRVYGTLVRVLRQSRPADQLLLLIDASVPDAARPWIDAVARRHAARVVRAEGEGEAATCDAALRACATSHALWLDAGDHLERDALRDLHAAAAARPQAALIASGWTLVGPGDERQVFAPPLTARDLMAAPPSAVGATLLPLARWASTGGFDSQAEPLHWHEFRLRLAAEAGEVVPVARTLLTRAWTADALYATTWGSAAESRAHAYVATRHAPVLGARVADVLYTRELALLDAARHYGSALARHRSAQHEIAEREGGAGAARSTSSEQVGQARQHPADVDMGDLRRVSPVARDWGYSRGVPLDRHYIEQFLTAHATDVAGRVLEVQEGDYARHCGGERVRHVDVLDLDPANAGATVIADLRCAANIGDATYDCVILTQTAHVIDDMPAAVSECARILRPGGVLLATFPAASRVCVEYGHDGDFWRLTPAGVRRLLEGAFAAEDVQVEGVGNLLSTVAFLHGLAGHELSSGELEARDPYYPLLVTARAIKPSAGDGRTRQTRSVGRRSYTGTGTPLVLLYHRVATPGDDSHGLCVSPDRFADHMRWLSQHADVVPLDTLVDAAHAGMAPSRAVAVTFDDGYVDVLESAAPVLRSLNLPATCFATTASLDEDSAYVFWWDALEGAILHGAPQRFEIAVGGSASGGDVLEVDTRTPASRERSHWRVYHAIVGLQPAERDRIVAELAAECGPIDRAPARRMRADELAVWARQPGLSIGAHSVHHPQLPRLAEDACRFEMTRSKCDLERLLASPVTGLAYPHGAVDATTARLAREAGFAFAVACEQTGGRFYPWLVPRLEVRPAVSTAFEATIRRAWGE